MENLITRDPWILELVSRGFKVPLLDLPNEYFQKPNCVLGVESTPKTQYVIHTVDNVRICDEEVKSLIHKGRLKGSRDPKLNLYAEFS